MNAVACSHAANDYLLTVTGLLPESELRWLRFNPRDLEAIQQFPRRDPGCRECSDAGRLGVVPPSRYLRVPADFDGFFLGHLVCHP